MLLFMNMTIRGILLILTFNCVFWGAMETPKAVCIKLALPSPLLRNFSLSFLFPFHLAPQLMTDVIGYEGNPDIVYNPQNNSFLVAFEFVIASQPGLQQHLSR